MKKGKIIVVEGTDCSGKETQTKLIVEKLRQENIKIERLSFPMYETSTGEIIGACLLGKPEMCHNLLKENHSFFKEGGGQVNPLVASMYYAADRLYNVDKINELINNGINVIIDRYVTSNMAHRGGFIKDKTERLKMYHKLETLEYEICELPKPDKTFLLYMPFEYGRKLRENRAEALDEVEKDAEYLKIGEKAYLELAEIYNYDKIDCVANNSVRSIEDINKELYQKVIEVVRDKNEY